MPPKPTAATTATVSPLQPPSENVLYEIGLDECGRGPLFGRVYAAAVILPRKQDSDPLAPTFDFSKIKDSKKIHSKKKMHELANYIKEHAISYSIQWVDTADIDRINILQADMQAMHECIHQILTQTPPKDTSLLIDGNYFKPYCVFDQEMNGGEGGLFYIPYETVEQGDSKHASIAAASILAKDARDDYILKLCEEYPELKTRYSLEKNMGYGTKAHLDGIRSHGITQWHRKTFGICKDAKYNPIG
jgi:ribonuclease HII